MPKISRNERPLSLRLLKVVFYVSVKLSIVKRDILFKAGENSMSFKN